MFLRQARRLRAEAALKNCGEVSGGLSSGDHMTSTISMRVCDLVQCSNFQI